MRREGWGEGVGGRGWLSRKRRGRDAEERECDRVVTEGESGALCVPGWRETACECVCVCVRTCAFECVRLSVCVRASPALVSPGAGKH